MSPHVYLVDLQAAAVARAGSRLEVTGSEGQHAAKVARVHPGEVIELVDGRGTRIQAEVVAVGRDEVTALVIQVTAEPAPDPVFVVVQALPKGEHADLAVDQLTQAGVDRIVPWVAANCVVRWDEQRAARGRQKWQQAALTAAKQSRRSWVPEVESLAGTAQVLAAAAQAQCVLVLHEEATDSIAQVDLPDTGIVMVVVGPEGGLAASERVALTELGAHQVRLGPEVLRTSLAGAAALAVLSGRGRWASSRPSGASSPKDGSADAMEGWRT